MAGEIQNNQSKTYSMRLNQRTEKWETRDQREETALILMESHF